MIKFHALLSEQTVYTRYFEQLRLRERVAHERLARICCNDYSRKIALVAEVDCREGETAGATEAEERQIVGVARLCRSRTANEAEFALLVADRFQGRGLGTELLRRLVEIGRDEKLDRVVGDIMADNTRMLKVSRSLGFRRLPGIECGIVSVELELNGPD